MRFLAAPTSSSMSSFAVESRVVRIASTSSKFRRSEALFRARDVDVRLPEVFDEFLDRDELRGGAPSLLQGAPLFLLLPFPPALREEPLEISDGMQDRTGPARFEVLLGLVHDRGESCDLDALPAGDLDRRTRPHDGGLGLAVQGDLHAFHDSFR